MSKYGEIIQAIHEGRNVFVTGQAGTGKSFILNRLRSEIPYMVVTASTGAAAVNVGGTTIHSFSGIGIGTKPASVIASNMWPQKIDEIIGCQILAIDEISMLSGKLFNLINKVFKYVRNDDRPFGGVKLVCIGDFLQLPPVSRDTQEKFAFESESWDECGFINIVLEKIYRQNDINILEILGRARFGKMTEHDERILNNPQQDHDEDIIRLFARNKPAQQFNDAKLNQLPGKRYFFKADDYGSPKHIESLNKYSLCPQHLFLKLEARVMLLINKDVSNGLINGSLGHVVELNNQFVTVQFDNGAEMNFQKEVVCKIEKGEQTLAHREQIPLRLAWAISIHKSQGMTLEKVKIDMGGIFEYGQGYVALSRAKSLTGLYVQNLRYKEVIAHPKAIEFMERIGK